MFVCKNCGTELNDIPEFCPNCGCKVQQQTTEQIQDLPLYENPGAEGKPSNKRTKWVLLGCILAALVVLGSAAAFFLVSNTPKALLTASLVRFGASLSGEQSEFSKAMEAGGTVEIHLDLSEQKSVLGMPGPVMNMVYSYDTEQVRSVLQLFLDLDGSNVFEIGLQESPKEMVLSCPGLISQSYGVDLEHFRENLDSSIFAPDSGSRYALSEETYQEILSAVETRPKVRSIQKDILKDRTFLKEMMTVFYQNAELDKEKESFFVGSRAVSACAVSARLDAEGLMKVLDPLMNGLRQEDDFLTLLESTPAEETDPKSSKTLREVLENWDTRKVELLEQWKKENMTLDLMFHISGKKDLLGMDATVRSDRVNTNVSLVFGENIHTSETVSMCLTVDGQENLNLLCTQTGGEKWTRTLTIRSWESGKEDEVSLLLSGNGGMESGDWLIRIESDSDISMSGTYQTGKDKLEIAVCRMEGDGESETLNLHITVSPEISIPEVPEYREILKLTEGDIMKILMEGLSGLGRFS